MHVELEMTLFIFILAAAGISLRVKDLLAAVVALGVFSFLSALLYVSMGAIDVALTEAVIGAGVTTVFFIVALFKTERKSND